MTQAIADIHGQTFGGFGQVRSSDAAANFPEQLCGTFLIETQWNGNAQLEVTYEYLVYKGVRIGAAECLITDGDTRLRFTAFVPGQTTEWLQGVVGVVESYDVVFDGAGGFEGTFRRQGEGILPTRGGRQESDQERAARMPGIMRQPSENSLGTCPICMEEWTAPNVVQTQTECGHAFCLSCVVATCNMTPPKTTGVCPLCKAPVSMAGLKRVVN